MGNELVPQNNGLLQVRQDLPDDLVWWADQFFSLKATSSPQSRKIQAYNIKLFLEFMESRVGDITRQKWIPRLSREFFDYLKNEINPDRDDRRWSDTSINLIYYQLKPLARWIHSLKPFPMGDPLDEIRPQRIEKKLHIEKALTVAQTRKLLSAADRLITRVNEKRPYRDRAIIFLLMTTGMRRSGISNLNLNGIDFKKGTITTTEKGGVKHTYITEPKALKALKQYINLERKKDDNKLIAVFLSDAKKNKSKGRLSPKAINRIWDHVCSLAKITGKSPHSARHTVARRIIEQTGNPAAVQAQLGHVNSTYSMQYMKPSLKELRKVIGRIVKGNK